MTQRLTRQAIAEKAIVLEAPLVREPATVDRNFELPAALYVGTAAAYVGFVVIMALGFGNPGLIVPMGIIAVFIAMFFGVPTMWMRMKPENPQRLTSWSRFQQRGVMTAYGHTPASAATVQVLILPVLILVWGLAVVTIAALVR
ncbi:MAG: hypothetical protein ABIT16_07195 [Croceibacterium sp.]